MKIVAWRGNEDETSTGHGELADNASLPERHCKPPGSALSSFRRCTLAATIVLVGATFGCSRTAADDAEAESAAAVAEASTVTQNEAPESQQRAEEEESLAEVEADDSMESNVTGRPSLAPAPTVDEAPSDREGSGRSGSRMRRVPGSSVATGAAVAEQSIPTAVGGVGLGGGVGAGANTARVAQVEVVAEEPQSRETYEEYAENGFVDASEDRLATFSVDVDTASYSVMRRDVTRGRLPAESSVRVEEYLNYFDYGYDAPLVGSETPFSVHTEVAPSEFGEGLDLLRIGIQGAEVAADERAPANLVFLIDVSGSMQSPSKLNLVKFALTSLVEQLRPDDTLGIVVYASRDAVLLEPTAVENKSKIFDAIESLTAGGSTAGQAGIQRAYRLAQSAFREGGINRVVLCTDGDFNVGLRGEQLLDYIARYRETGINITTLGFGMGNYNDTQMEQIADRGNGNYAYVDSRNEALRVLGDNLVGTLQVIAKDVKIQVEVNDALVDRYRLVGYDNRVLRDRDFRDDSVDAAEIGAGHNVTALLELDVNDAAEDMAPSTELATVRIRYKSPGGDVSREIEHTVQLSDLRSSFADASDSFRFAAAVAEYAEILRGSEYSEGRRFRDVLQTARDAADSSDPTASELLGLIRAASDMPAAAATR